jgi:alkanesulfonate monooxygenase SsuD/methylene tetrahydromethanopterin reductase-like flavin-dependent oxidoreductase (luciferase family)
MSGELADGVILNWADPAYLATRLPELINGARAAGRDPNDINVCYALFCEVTDSPAATTAARERFREQLAFYLQPETYRLRFRAMGFDEQIDRIETAQASDQPVAPHITDSILDAISAIGELDACRARIAEYRQSGVDLPLLVPLAIENGDPAPIERTLTALAAD